MKLNNREIQIIYRAIETINDYSFWDDGEYDFDNEVAPALEKLLGLLITK